MRKGKSATKNESLYEQSNAVRKRNAKFVIGVDPGTNTGVAVWCAETKKLVDVETGSIYQAIKKIESFRKISVEIGNPDLIFVRFEDAAKRTWFGKSGPERYKGAGSIERDCAIWREVLNELHIPFESVAPKDLKGTPDAETFNRLTGWKGRTSVHARDAAWLVFGS